MAKFHRQGQSGQFVEQGSQVAAMLWRPGKARRKLQQNRRQLLGLDKRRHAVTVLGGLSPPLVGIHFVG